MAANDNGSTVNEIITSEQFQARWKGHRDLTRRTIEAFPDDQLFTFSIGGMRTFGKLVHEMLRMAVPTLEGVVTREWKNLEVPLPEDKGSLLEAWDADTTRLDALWSQVPPGRFQEDDVAFGQWPGKVEWIVNYVIDNEIHHRAQGYVYLRALGFEPPGFWDRPS